MEVQHIYAKICTQLAAEVIGARMASFDTRGHIST